MQPSVPQYTYAKRTIKLATLFDQEPNWGKGMRFLLGALARPQLIQFDPTQEADRKAASDPAAEVVLTQPPTGHTEDQLEADKLLINSMYTKVNQHGDAYDSVYILVFHPRGMKNQDLKDYVARKKQRFFFNVPRGEVSEVQLHDSVTEHLKQEGVPFESIMFNSMHPHQRKGQLSLFLQTPNGFWDFIWHSSMKNLNSPTMRSSFVDAVQSLKVVPKKEAVTKQKRTVEAVATPATTEPSPNPVK